MKLSSIALVLAAVVACASVNAKTIAWYHLNESPAGTVTDGQSTFLNAVDPAKHVGVFRTWAPAPTSAWAYPPVITDGESDYYPRYVDGLRDEIKFLDPVSCEIFDSGTAMRLQTADATSASSKGGIMMIEDHEELHLKSFTLEFFLKVPAESVGGLYRFLARKPTDNRKHYVFEIHPHNSSKQIQACINTATVDPESGTNIWKTFSISASSSTYVMGDDYWHRVALVVDNDAKKATLWYDKSARTVTFTGELDYDGTGAIGFGAPPDTYYGSWQGYIDEIRISDCALSESELLRPYFRPSVVSAATTPSTLVFLDFEGSTEAETYDEFKESIRPVGIAEAMCNKAAWNSSYTNVPVVMTTYRTTDPAFIQTNDVPFASIRSGVADVSSVADLASFRFGTNGVEGTRPACVFLPDSQRKLFSDSVTIEFAFKIMPGAIQNIAAWNTTTLSACQGCYNITVWAAGQDGRMSLSFGNSGSLPVIRGSGNGGTRTAESFNDGKWHTMAVVYDRDANTGKYYIDGELRASASGFAFSDQTPSSTIQGLSFAGAPGSPNETYRDDDRYLDIKIDNVRVTRGALKPYQLLTAIPAEPGVLARASFESDLVMHPYTNFFGAAGVASAFVSGGSVPGFSVSVPSRVLTAGRDGEVVMDSNRRSLSFDGGKVAYSERSLLADTDEFTVEFFIKSSSAAAGAGIMRVNRGSSTDVASAVTWALSFADASGNLRLKVDTDAATGQTHDFSGSFADGLWHHVALQFAGNGDDSVVTLFKDAEAVGSWNVSGRLVTKPSAMNFMIGAGEDETAGFVGLIDELRVSPGIVESSAFLTPLHKGLIIFCR